MKKKADPQYWNMQGSVDQYFYFTCYRVTEVYILKRFLFPDPLSKKWKYILIPDLEITHNNHAVLGIRYILVRIRIQLQARLLSSLILRMPKKYLVLYFFL